MATIGEMEAKAGELVNALHGPAFPCKAAGGKSCSHKAMDLKPRRDGKPQFWFGSDCQYPYKHFCDPCLAYWHIACARNILLAAVKAEMWNEPMADGR